MAAASLEEVWARFINETLRTLSLSEVDLPTDPEAIRILAKELGFSALDRTKVVSFFKSKKAAENAAAALREPNEEGIQGRMLIDNVSKPDLLPTSLNLYDKDFKPTCPVMDSLKGLSIYQHDQLVSWCQTHSRQVVASTIAAAAGLNFEDVFSLLIYSFEIGGDRREENVYFRLNKILKERNNLTELLRWRNYLYFLLRAVRKLPNTGPCRVYRAIDVKVGREKYDSGDEVVWNTFTSTTLKREVSERLATTSKSKHLSLFVIDLNNARIFTPFSNENEILIEPNSEFEVEDLKEGQRWTAVHLRQLPTRFPILLPDVD